MIDETPDLPPEPPRKPDAWEIVCVGILRTEFGRRPSRAVNSTILRLAAEEAASSTGVKPVRESWYARLDRWCRSLQPRTAFALCLAMVLAAGLGVYFVRSHEANRSANDQLAVNTVTDALDLRWGNKSPRLKMGSKIPTGLLYLESGVVEITFASAAKVAIEGPAQFQLTGPNAMELQAGKISTDVPKQAKGFSVTTPTATMIDLGTRFGAIVGSDKSSEVDVFQGRIQLRTADGTPKTLRAGMAMIVDTNGAISANALPETAFPQPNLAVEVRPQNCGFDVSGRTAVGQVPSDFGYWSGPAYSLTEATREVTPASGPGMLEFCNPSAPHSGDSEVWQMVDLRAYKNLLVGGTVEAKLTTLFNRIAGDANAANRFGLALAAYHGTPDNAGQLWADRQSRALAFVDKELASDNDPETWETLEADIKLPPGTDFVIIQIRAIAPGGNSAALAGHFADRVDLWLCAPMKASSLAIK